MVTIAKNKVEGATLKWDIYRGRTCVRENFTSGEVWVFLRNATNAYPISVTLSTASDGGQQLQGTLPVVEAGTYELKAVWYKTNSGLVDDNVPHSMTKVMVSEVFDAFMVSSDVSSVTTAATIAVQSNSQSYGYDGLSAWEMAVISGKTSIDESSWVANLTEMNEAFGKTTDTLDEGYTTVWAYENDRRTQEDTRQENETIRQNQEGTSSDEPSATGSRWARYKQAEADRNTSYTTAEGTFYDDKSSTGSRWAQYNYAEDERAQNFNDFQEGRRNAYLEAEGDKDSGDTGGGRWGMYYTAEGKSTDTPSDTGSRWARFLKAEENRANYFSISQANQQKDYKLSENNREESYSEAEAERNTKYNTAEGNEDSGAGDGSRWGEYYFQEGESDSNNTNVRWGKYNANEGTTRSESTEASRWGYYKAEEDSRNDEYNANEGTTKSSGTGSRWGKFNTDEQTRTEIFESKEAARDAAVESITHITNPMLESDFQDKLSSLADGIYATYEE